MRPTAAIVQQQEETQQELLQRIRTADSHTKWATGEWISLLKERYQLTDEQIAQQTDLSRESVTQRRLVWETFADCKAIYTQLSWTHFYVALSWNDAPECLQWADELQASVSEMKAWRRSQHGEDLQEPDESDHNWPSDSDAAETDEHNLCGEEEEGIKDEPGVPARAEQEPVRPPSFSEQRSSAGESRQSPALPVAARDPAARLDQAIQECLNVHAAIVALRKLSHAMVESCDPEQLQEYADALQSCLNIVQGQLRAGQS